MQTRSTVAILALVAAVAASAVGQEPPKPPDGKEKPAATAEQPKAPPSPPQPPAPPKGEVKVGLTGFVQIDYRLGDAAGQKTAAEHEFNGRRIRLAYNGKVNEKISYNVAFQGDGLNVNTGSLIDTFVDISFSPLLKLRAGQFKYTWDMQGLEGAPVMAFLDRPFITNAVAGSMNGASTASSPAGAFRDRGVSLYGDSKPGGLNWGYALGLFQGVGRASDNNSDFGYMLNFHVIPAGDLKLNAGYMTSDSLNQGATGKNDYQAWNAGASYEGKKVTARAEYYLGTRDSGTARDMKGYYVMGLFAPTTTWDVMARYQQMEDEQFTKDGNTADSFDLGAKWYAVRRGKRGGTNVGVNYMLRGAEKGFNRGMTLLNDGRGAALTNGDHVKGVFMVRLQVQF